MVQHGEIDPVTKRIFCSYWMTIEEWDSIHSYSPTLDETFEDKNDIAE